jgi:hypothetical protein
LNSIEPLIGFAVVILFAVLTVFFSVKKVRNKFPPIFRKLAGAYKLRHAIGLAVEDGTRLHVSLGSGNITESTNSSGLVGLSTLNRIGQLASNSDLPPMSTSGNGSFQVLSQDVSRQNMIESNSSDLLDPGLAQLSGVTPFSYAAGVMEAMHDSGVSSNVFIGSFGAEAGLICDAAGKNQTYSLAGSESMVGQSVFFAGVEDTLIGEELYALPAYLGYHPAHQASVRVQDIFRAILILFLLGGVILKMLGVI